MEYFGHLNLWQTQNMNDKLRKKLAYLQVNKYANKLEGIDSFSIIDGKKEDYSWYKENLNSFWLIKRIDWSAKLEQPVAWRELSGIVREFLKEHPVASGVQLFEDTIALNLRITNFDLLLNSIFKYNGNYDLSLLILNPERLLMIDDSEYSVYIKYIEQ